MTDVLYTPVRAAPSAASVPLEARRVRRWVAGLPRRRWEPWRDWALITLMNNALLLTVALLQPRGLLLVLAAVPVAVGFAIGTLTVLHDAGHRMFSNRSWPNVLAVQTSTPAGLWVSHWTLKHRVHHKLSQVYPIDEATRSSSMVRLHPDAPGNRWQRAQHFYAWPLYGLAWAGELRSQLRYLRTGEVTGIETPPGAKRLASFVAEKGLCLLVLAPYAWLLGVGRLALLMLVVETLASLIAAVVLVVGHINEGLTPSSQPPGRAWAAYLVRTTASFSTNSRAMRWFTGGMTHHLAHHLRPVAVRSELPRLHETVVRDVVASTGLNHVEYPTLHQAVAGHWRRLRELGQPDAVRPTVVRSANAGEPATARRVPEPAA